MLNGATGSQPMADNFKNGGAPDRSRVSIDDQHEVRYWTETIGCSKDELTAAVARVGNSSEAVRREVYRHWAYGTVRRDAQRPRGRPSKRSVKARVRSPKPPHNKGSENPADNTSDDPVNPLALPGGHLSLPQPSSASRFTAGASGFFILSQSGERPER